MTLREVWFVAIGRLVHERDVVTSWEVWDACAGSNRMNPVHAEKVADVMRTFGFRKRKQRMYKGGNAIACWVRI